MSNLLESLRAALTAIFAHKLRSVLTTLGIIIGVMSVIAVVSLLQGFSVALSVQLQGHGLEHGIRDLLSVAQRPAGRQDHQDHHR